MGRRMKNTGSDDSSCGCISTIIILVLIAMFWHVILAIGFIWFALWVLKTILTPSPTQAGVDSAPTPQKEEQKVMELDVTSVKGANALSLPPSLRSEGVFSTKNDERSARQLNPTDIAVFVRKPDGKFTTGNDDIRAYRAKHMPETWNVGEEIEADAQMEIDREIEDDIEEDALSGNPHANFEYEYFKDESELDYEESTRQLEEVADNFLPEDESY